MSSKSLVHCSKQETFRFREIHGMVEWLVSESMVMYYIHLFRDSMWPGGELAKPAAQRTDLVKEFIILLRIIFVSEERSVLSVKSFASRYISTTVHLPFGG